MTGKCIWILATAALGVAAAALAEDVTQPKEYQVTMKLYGVQTSITGNGLTSRTLPAVQGFVHVLHQRLGDVALVMEGGELTWDGERSPQHDGISLLSAPTVWGMEGERVIVVDRLTEPMQYFDRIREGVYELKTVELPDMDARKFRARANEVSPANSSGPRGKGVLYSFVPKPAASNADDIIDLDFYFVMVRTIGREPVEGLNLNVGRPKLDKVLVEGAVQVRDGEWACYTTPTRASGYLYLFMKVIEWPAGTRTN